MSALTVSDIITHLNHLLSVDEITSDLCIIGEVSRVSTASSGHSYFTIKDSDSSLDCALFRGGIGSEHIQQGSEILVFGKVSIYGKSGRLQVIANLIQPSGTGLLQAKFEEMKTRLEKEGLFDVSRKRNLPKFPRVIGVVTSEDAAAWEDIKTTITNRFPKVEIHLSHSLVQGDAAPQQISEAIDLLNNYSEVDVIIVGRGGGSVEDLWAFNEEIVARAIFSSKIPVVTGIGHETDFSISDMVADFSASTPTAAAVSVVPDLLEINQQILNFKRRFNHNLSLELEKHKNSLSLKINTINQLSPDFDYYKFRIDESMIKIDTLFSDQLRNITERIQRFEEKLSDLSPSNTISRGYSIVQNKKNGNIIKSKDDVEPGDKFSIQVSDGIIDGVAERTGNGSSNHQPQLL
ncbi:MAG: exodeoxyribonuclease VII large subunit [SAR202 cluster bacterium]|nr:MAG: exodeoxyribonuclease VII large subunit [SAR202 cluster bacterium]